MRSLLDSHWYTQHATVLHICLCGTLFLILRLYLVYGSALMNSREQELFDTLLSKHNRRDFIKRAGALGLSASALTAFLEACGSSTSTDSTTSNSPPNIAGPTHLPQLITHPKKECRL